MDTSETYVKMCEKAGAVQEIDLQKADEGSFLFMEGRIFTKAECVGIVTHPVFWLPRQDQLQEMMEEKNFWRLFREFELFLEIGDGYEADYAQNLYSESSGEQLWLAFVMKEKYGKTWNGEDWIA